MSLPSREMSTDDENKRRNGWCPSPLSGAAAAAAAPTGEWVGTNGTASTSFAKRHTV